MTPKGHRSIRGYQDLLYETKGHGDLCDQFEATGLLEVAISFFITPKITVIFVIGLIQFMTPKAPVRHTLQPLCDLSAIGNFNRSQRSQQGPREVLARLQRSQRLIGDLVATKSVAARFLHLHKNLAATDLVASRSPISRRLVPDRSATDRRPVAD